MNTRKARTPNDIRKEIHQCLRKLNITRYEAILLSEYSQNRPLYTLRQYVFMTIQKHLLTKDLTISNRINELFPSNEAPFHECLAAESQKIDIVERYLSDNGGFVFTQENGHINFSKMEEILQKAFCPFCNLISNPPSKHEKSKICSSRLYPISCLYVDLDIMYMVMFLDAFFYAIDDTISETNKDRISLIKEILYGLSKYGVTFPHTKWIFDLIELGSSFRKISQGKSDSIFDEYSLFAKLLKTISKKKTGADRVAFLFVLYEANKGSHFLDALYNNYHSIPSFSLNPYLYGRLYPSFEVNIEKNSVRYFDKNVLQPSYIMNDLYPKIVDSWKETIKDHFDFTHKIKTEELLTILGGLGRVEFIENYLGAINITASIQSALFKLVHNPKQFNANWYYQLIETQSAYYQLDGKDLKYEKKRRDILEEARQGCEIHEWEEYNNIDEFPFEHNPFLEFAKTHKSCFFDFFNRNVNDINLIINNSRHKKNIKEEENLDRKKYINLFKMNPDIREEIEGVFAWEKNGNQYSIYKNTIKDDKIDIVFRKSPMEWKSIFDLFCNISFGKKSLAKSSKVLQVFECNCRGSEQYHCRKDFMKIIENNVPISKTEVLPKGMGK